MTAVIYCKTPSTLPLEHTPTVENNTCYSHGNYIHYNCMCIYGVHLRILTRSST